jgi:mono/diheme cytochrome c family protein
MLVALPIWAIIYAFTLDPETPKELGPLQAGSEIYSGSCSACHGGTGEGAGNNPKLADGEVLKTFPEPAEQVRWVFLGSDNYKADFGDTYGATNKPVKSGMPSWSSLTSKEIMEVVLHERHTLSGETFDIKAWENVAEVMKEVAPDRATEFQEVVEEWAATPPTE